MPIDTPIFYAGRIVRRGVDLLEAGSDALIFAQEFNDAQVRIFVGDIRRSTTKRRRVQRSAAWSPSIDGEIRNLQDTRQELTVTPVTRPANLLGIIYLA